MYQSIGYDKKNNIMHVWDDELGHQKFPFQHMHIYQTQTDNINH